MRDFSVLSDVEFEELAGDLLGVEFDTTVERFAAGADGGTDLRWNTLEGPHIAQCKHYRRSSFSQLAASAREEAGKVKKLRPARYFFITTFDLSVSQKQRLYSLFSEWMTGPENVLGGKDIDALITRHREVERRHPKLWVSTGMQLFWNLHADIANRTEALRQRIERAMPKYIVNSGYETARHLIDEHNVCLISGPPGIGKTTLAQMLLAEYISSGYEPIEVSADINEAWSALSQDTRQIFLYDDFLGQITFSERLAKNEDKRLSDLIERFSLGDSKKKLVLTTREYILRDAKLTYERLNDLDKRFQYVLELADYSKSDRAHILYNHLWHSDIGLTCLREVVDGGYKEIIEHPAYNPRIVEYCTGRAFDVLTPGYPDRFKATLDNPEKIWRIAFEKHLTTEQKLLVLVVCTLPLRVHIEVLQEAHAALCKELGIVSTGSSYREALDVLEGTFISISKDDNGGTNIRHVNPSVTEFALARIAADQTLLASIVNSAVFFEQLIELFRYGAGGSHLHPGNAVLMAALNRSRSDFIRAMGIRFESPSSRRYEAQLPSGRRVLGEHSGKMESRVDFYLQVDSEWGLDPDNIRTRIEYIFEYWRTHRGYKSSSYSLYGKISDLSLPSDVLRASHDAFHGWLEETLYGADDWHIYARHLTDHDDVELSDALELAERFEEFVNLEFHSSSHTDLNLNRMKALAEDLSLYDLSDEIEEAIQAQREPDFDDYERPASLHWSDDRDSDSDIAELFSRLGGE
ncbi:ATP-binding protein [Streptomyces sp. NPDC048710]|uniref:ATP-binding protein n=1 Tax=Streptomyces sp. NPDC048710 TaxID=3365586 RepID=UPI00371A0446